MVRLPSLRQSPDNGRGQGRQQRERPSQLIGGQCRDNTPIVEDKGGCVPLELDTREAGEAERQPQLCPLSLLYYIWMYCVVLEPQLTRPTHSFPPKLDCWSRMVGLAIFNGNKGRMNPTCPYIHHFYNTNIKLFLPSKRTSKRVVRNFASKYKS